MSQFTGHNINYQKIDGGTPSDMSDGPNFRADGVFELTDIGRSFELDVARAFESENTSLMLVIRK